jgi:hypothetical protein
MVCYKICLFMPVQQQVGEVSSALEPQVAIKSTKRASIVGVALELFWRRIVVMPLKAKLDLCHYAKVYVPLDCPLDCKRLNRHL